MRSPVAVILAALAVALLLSGCRDPYEKRAAEAARAATATATATPAATEPAPSTASAPQATAVGAVRTFAERWGNWSWRDVREQQLRLAELATGELREELRAGGEQPLDTIELERSQPGVEGRIEIVAFKRETGDRRPVVVVIREQALARDEPVPGGLHYTTYLAEAQRVPGGWAVARWDGQP